MQDAAFADPDTTCGTGDRGQLFGSEVVFLHSDTIRNSRDAKQFNLEHFPTYLRPGKKLRIFRYGGQAGLIVEDDA
jgi:hypothetical protein